MSPDEYINSEYKKLYEEHKSLKEKLDVAREALKFYAESYGGDTAKEALKRIGE